MNETNCIKHIKDYIRKTMKNSDGSEVLIGIDTEDMAQRKFADAIASLGRLEVVPWNKRPASVTLTASKSEYEIGTDIITDFSKIQGIHQIWRTDIQNTRVVEEAVDVFSGLKQGDTTTGQPYYFCQRNNADGNLVIEFWKIPDSAYTLWVYFRIPLTFEMIPDDFKEIVAWKGVTMLADIYPDKLAYAEGKYQELLKEIKSTGYTVFDGSFIEPDVLFASSGGGRHKADSGNYWGKI